MEIKTNAGRGVVWVRDAEREESEGLFLYEKRGARMLLPVEPRAVAAWSVSGAMIQNALPMLNSGQREFLLTGITPERWTEMFGDSLDGGRDD